ncbi:hypothetical protein PE067_15730 [Paracoccus sp. DMF-8]|uniref:hypothetical protein n=1 Tax=Paracoccus sp. DMF-8 TaxID=3019445 RepID=UPI0023E38E33|nr:hypothetical protein [Paracoccus sp. DMF-8]MDF3607459.1 hypothetical protein [Paracoccus sp. DMF-8]
MAGTAGHPPETLVKALALGWSLAIFDGATTLVLQGPPRIRGRVLRGDDWLLALPQGIALMGFQRISRNPTACNHGMALSLPMGTCAPRLLWRNRGCIPVTGKPAPRLPALPPGHRAIGLTMSPRASALGHPFAQTLPQDWQDQRHAAERAILGGQPLPHGLPRDLLRCVLRDLAASAPGKGLSELARLHDRPLYRALTG